MCERRTRDLGTLPGEPSRAVRQIREGSTARARESHRWVRAGPRPSAADREGQRNARRRRRGHGHGDERRGKQPGDDRRAHGRDHRGGSSSRRHPARCVRVAVARRARWASGPRRSGQAPRGSVLWQRPIARGRDDPARPASHGARDPVSASHAARRREAIIGLGCIDARRDGFPVSWRRLGGRPPRDGPEERADFVAVRLRPPPSGSTTISDTGTPVDGMFVSHAHLDHTGMIPWITRRQDVDVVLTPPTADVADLLLQDSLKIADAEGFDAPFDDGDLRTARRRFRTIDFGDNVDIGDLEVTAHPAGHIPGATMYEVNGAETTLFTGDLHTLTTDLVWGAKPVHCDTLFIESTYAGRQHPERLKSEHAFLRKVEQVVNRGGLALVPSFAVGRTQDVLLTLAKARHEVWLDGMGKKVNSIYIENPQYIKSVKALRKAMHHVSVVRGPRDSQMAVEGEVIVTTSGMLDGGPVLRYLEKIREDPRSAVLLTGYQVEGTNGRRLIEEGVIDLYGVTVDIKCEWQKFDFSAHAGHDDLVRFIEACDPQRVVLMHGENRQILADALEGREVLMPQEGKWYTL